MSNWRDGERYNVTVEGAHLVESQRTGTPGIEVSFMEESLGPIRHTFWLTEKTKQYVERDLKTLGITDAQLKNPNFWQEPGDYLRGCQASIKIRLEEYKGKWYPKVAYVNEWREQGGGQYNSAAANAAAMFGAKLTKPTATPPPAKTAPASEEITDDDIPF